MDNTQSYFVSGSIVRIAVFGTADGTNTVSADLLPDPNSSAWEDLGEMESSTPAPEPQETTIMTCGRNGMYHDRKIRTSVTNALQFTVREIKKRTLELAYGIEPDGSGGYKPFANMGTIQAWIEVTLTDSMNNGAKVMEIYVPGTLKLMTPPTNQGDAVSAQFALDVEDNSLSTAEWFPDTQNP